MDACKWLLERGANRDYTSKMVCLFTGGLRIVCQRFLFGCGFTPLKQCLVLPISFHSNFFQN